MASAPSGLIARGLPPVAPEVVEPVPLLQTVVQKKGRRLNIWHKRIIRLYSDGAVVQVTSAKAAQHCVPPCSLHTPAGADTPPADDCTCGPPRSEVPQRPLFQVTPSCYVGEAGKGNVLKLNNDRDVLLKFKTPVELAEWRAAVLRLRGTVTPTLSAISNTDFVSTLDLAPALAGGEPLPKHDHLPASQLAEMVAARHATHSVRGAGSAVVVPAPAAGAGAVRATTPDIDSDEDTIPPTPVCYRDPMPIPESPVAPPKKGDGPRLRLFVGLPNPASSVRAALKARFKQALTAALPGPRHTNVLCMDDAAARVLTPLLSVSELAAMSFTVLELLHDPQHGLSKSSGDLPLHVVYLLSPQYRVREFRDARDAERCATALPRDRRPFASPEQWAAVLHDAVAKGCIANRRSLSMSDPTSLEFLMQDFVNRKRLFYSAASVVMLGLPGDEQWQTFTATPNLGKWVNQDFLVVGGEALSVDDCGFSAGFDTTFGALYHPNPEMPSPLAQPTLHIPMDRAWLSSMFAARVASLCLALNVDPIVRFSLASTSPLACMVATQLAEHLSSQSFVFPEIGRGASLAVEAPTTTVLVVDRSFDLETVLVHDLTYQPMLYDAFRLTTGDIRFPSRGAIGAQAPPDVDGGLVPCVLNDSDALWPQVKDRRIDDVHQVLKEEMSRIQAFHKGVTDARYDSSPQSLSALRSAFSGLPGTVKAKDSLSLHIDVLTAALAATEADGVVGPPRPKPADVGADADAAAGPGTPVAGSSSRLTVVEIEQTLVSGVDAFGRTVKPHKLFPSMVQSLAGVPAHVCTRVAMLYAVCAGGLNAAEREAFTTLLSPEAAAAVDKLHWLGCDLNRVGATSLPPRDIVSSAQAIAKAAAMMHEPRRRCRLDGLVASVLGSSMTSSTFPVIYPEAEVARESLREAFATEVPPPPPASASKRLFGLFNAFRKSPPAPVRSARTKHLRPPPISIPTPPASRQRIIVAVVGGVTPAELVAARRLSATGDAEVVVIGTNIMSPEKWLHEVGCLP